MNKLLPDLIFVFIMYELSSWSYGNKNGTIQRRIEFSTKRLSLFFPTLYGSIFSGVGNRYVTPCIILLIKF